MMKALKTRQGTLRAILKLLVVSISTCMSSADIAFRTEYMSDDDDDDDDVAFEFQADEMVTTFCAIADIPYTDVQRQVMEQQISEVPDDCEFLIHLGDMRKGDVCLREEYESVATILQQSTCPVFLVLGDNEWNDCPNMDEGLNLWRENFVGFEDKHWDFPQEVTREPGRDTSFTSEMKGTLFIGLTIVGAPIIDQDEWDNRLREEFEWTRDVIRDYQKRTSPSIGRVVLFVHAEPRVANQLDLFFTPLRDFIANEANDIPILYLHGDDHKWQYDPNFLSLPNLLRISMTGEGKEPVTKFMVHANGQAVATETAFQYDRQLDRSSDACNSFCRSSLPFGQDQSKAIHLELFGECLESCTPTAVADLKLSLGWKCGPC